MQMQDIIAAVLIHFSAFNPAQEKMFFAS